MSNHSGSYLLNEVLLLLEKRGAFDLLGKEPSQKLVLEMIHLSKRYDCNPGEILDEIGMRVGICYYCLTAQSDLMNGVCNKCRVSWSEGI
jgi:hypothetical protein